MSSPAARERAGLPAVDPESFSIGRGAPFLHLQEHLRLVERGSLSATRRALFFAAVCWLPLLLLAALRGNLLEPAEGRAFLRDFTVPARFLVAVPILLLIEPVADVRLARLVREFATGGLVPEERVEDFREAVVEAHRGRDSGLAEAAIALLSLAGGFAWVRAALRTAGSSWIGDPGPAGDVVLSSAGWWAALVSVPIGLFLLVRWLWRYALWARLLRRLSRLDLRVVATHPDRCGGLAFIGQFPVAFTGFAFATTTIVAAALARLLVWGGGRIEDVQSVLAAWSLLVIALFVLPLVAFARPLRVAKARALLDFAALSLRHNRAFERRWIDGGAPAEELLGAPDSSSLADLATGYQAAKAMRTIPLVAEGLVPVAVAVAVPLACAVATQVPVRTMLKTLGSFVL